MHKQTKLVLRVVFGVFNVKLKSNIFYNTRVVFLSVTNNNNEMQHIKYIRPTSYQLWNHYCFIFILETILNMYQWRTQKEFNPLTLLHLHFIRICVCTKMLSNH